MEQLQYLNDCHLLQINSLYAIIVRHLVCESWSAEKVKQYISDMSPRDKDPQAVRTNPSIGERQVTDE
jgi:hypothetical protein